MKVETIHTDKGLILLGEGKREPGMSKRVYERFLIDQLLIQAGIDPDELQHALNGQPFLLNRSTNLSISHSAQYGALYVSQAAVGIDIQCVGKDLERGRSYFTNASEQTFSGIEDLYLIWGAKEVLFKQFGGAFTDANKEISVLEIDRNQNHIIVHTKKKAHRCLFVETPDYCLVYS